MVLTPVVVGLMWRFLLYPHAGFVTYYVEDSRNCSVFTAPQFLANPKLRYKRSFGSIFGNGRLSCFWFCTRAFFNPSEPYEAARVDGASKWFNLSYDHPSAVEASILIVLLIGQWMLSDIWYDLCADRRWTWNSTETLSIFFDPFGLQVFLFTSRAAG